VPHSRPSFGLEWGFSFVPPYRRGDNRKDPLKLRLNGAPEGLPGPPAPGDTFKLSAADDLVINGRVAIAKGAPATGRTIAVKKKKGLANDGMLEIAIDSVPAVNGENVALDEHLTIGGGAVSFGRKSRDAQLEKGHILTAHVATETTVAN